MDDYEIQPCEFDHEFSQCDEPGLYFDEVFGSVCIGHLLHIEEVYLPDRIRPSIV